MYKFCCNSTIIRIRAILEQNNDRIIVRTPLNFTEPPDSEITVVDTNFMETLKFLGKNYLVNKTEIPGEKLFGW